LKKINVLGAKYTVIEQSESQNPKLKKCDGYCDETVKNITVVNLSERVNDDMSKGDLLGEYRKKVMRHEIIHAFLYESGLAENSDWARNEEIVDWIAMQFPKLLKVFNDIKCL
jgi:hypothetical protein